MAVYGLYMLALGWGRAAVVWNYALAWFMLNERVKRVAYCRLDPHQVL